MAIETTANRLRRLAEKADGEREKVFELKLVDSKLELVQITESQARSLPADSIIVKTRNKTQERKKPRTVELTTPKGRVVPIGTDNYDMVLWGEAAAEKFLLPYYIRFYTDVEMAALQTAILNADVIAILHVYPTFYDRVLERFSFPRLLAEEILAGRIVDDFWVVTDSDEKRFEPGFLPLTWFATR